MEGEEGKERKHLQRGRKREGKEVGTQKEPDVLCAPVFCGPEILCCHKKARASWTKHSPCYTQAR